MEPYIKKSDIIAEIERLQGFFVNKLDDFEKGYHHGLDMVLAFLDTIETKDVDLEKEIVRVSKNKYFDFTDWKSIARHFYELGLKAKDVNEIIKTAEDHAYFAGSENTREKLIDKACKWLKENATYTHPRKGTEECIINIPKFIEYIKGG